MAESRNAIRSNDCAAPTDTNPTNLELASLQSVTATIELYIQIGHSHLKL